MKLDRAALRAHPLPPIIDGDKETKGRILVVAGSTETCSRQGTDIRPPSTTTLVCADTGALR